MGDDDPKSKAHLWRPSPEAEAWDEATIATYAACRDRGKTIADALLTVDADIGDNGLGMMKAIRAYEQVSLGEAKKLFYANRPMDHPNFVGHGPDGVPSHR